MEQYIKKSLVLAEIENLLDKGKHHEEYDCAYRDGNNGALYTLKGKLDTLEVKEVDLEHLEQEVKDFCYEYDDRKDKWYDMTPHDKNIMVNPTWSNFAMQLAKHFFELGLNASNPTTAADRGTAEEIIISLKRVEKDYRIDLTREIEWLRNKVKNGEV